MPVTDVYLGFITGRLYQVLIQDHCHGAFITEPISLELLWEMVLTIMMMITIRNCLHMNVEFKVICALNGSVTCELE